LRPKNAIWTLLLLLGLGLVGCGDDETPTDTHAALVARGQYLVEHVAACIDCHTPRTTTGELDHTKWLAGTPFADLVPGDDSLGAIWAPNLTPDSTGLMLWTDTQIKTAFQNGVDEDGGALFPIMPYFIFHNMTPGDADAVVAFLRSIPAVHNPVPPRQPLGFPFTQPAQPVPVAAIPHTSLPSTDPHYVNAENGRYLASMAGVCIECHTKEAQGPGVPLQLDSLFAGGRGFELGLPVPPWPAIIYSANITPDSTGIQGMTPEDVRTVLLNGVDEHGVGICPPMPVGPSGAFGGLTSSDALDLGYYVTTLPPITNRVPDCTPP